MGSIGSMVALVVTGWVVVAVALAVVIGPFVGRSARLAAANDSRYRSTTPVLNGRIVTRGPRPAFAYSNGKTDKLSTNQQRDGVVAK